MASAPQTAQLPLFYKDLMPLNSRDHAGWSSRTTETAVWMVGQHAIPLTAEEFVHAGRHFPIVFSIADNPVPLALMCGPAPKKLSAPATSSATTPPTKPSQRIGRIEPEIVSVEYCGTRITW